MREEVIVHVKQEVHSEDEEEIDPSTMAQSSSSTGITAEVTANTSELNLESSSPSESTQHDWPCAVCGRLFQQREEVLEHTKTEHAEQMFQVIMFDEGLRAKLAAFQQQQRLLSLLQNTPAAGLNFLQQPAAAAAMLQLLQNVGGTAPKTEVPLVPSFPAPSRKVARQEKAGSPYESRRGRPRHPVWSLFVRIDKFDAECTLCKSRVRSACPTNLCRHLNNNHCELASQLFVKWKKQKEELGGSFPPLEPRANRHKSSSTSSTSSSVSCSSVPPPPSMATPQSTLTVPSLPGFPHLNLVLQQQQLLLKQREQSAGLSPEVLKAIDTQLLVNSNIIAHAQKTLESTHTTVATVDKEEEQKAGPSREGVIQYGGVERQHADDSVVHGDEEMREAAIDILSASPDLDDLIQSATAAAAAARRRRSHSAPPPSDYCREDREGRSSTAPPMLTLMEGNNAFDMYAYQDAQCQSQQVVQTETAATLRQPTQETIESWFSTAYAQPVQLGATAVMNAGAYGTMAPQTDAAGLAATVAETASFPAEIKNVPLFTDEQHLFAASSSSSDPQQQLQLFQTIKQELQLDDMGDESSSSHRPSVFQTAPPSSLLMSQLLPGQTPAKRGRPTENPCWEHFERLDDTLVKCRTCDKVVKSACATNMTKHLERHHPEEYQVLLQKIRYSRQFKPNTTPVTTSSTPSSSSTQQQFPSGAMALNHIVHQPQHHLLQPMASDLGQPLNHHLPLSPDPSPAAPHCFLSTQHHLLKDPSSLRPEMLLIPTSDGLIPNVDPNSYHIPSDFYQTMQFDNTALFDNASQWQQRHFAPSTGYEQWMGGDQSSSAMLMNDEWSQSAAAAVQQHTQQQAALDQLQLQQHSVIQSVVANTASNTDVLDAAALAAAAAVAVSSDASSTSSTSSSSCAASTSLAGMLRSHESKPYMKRNRKTEHPVWEFFKRTADGNAQCSICNGIVKSPCSSNFMRHLMRHHSNEYNAVYAKWSQKRGSPIKSTSASF